MQESHLLPFTNCAAKVVYFFYTHNSMKRKKIDWGAALLPFRGRHVVPTERIGDWGAALLPFRGRARPYSLEVALSALLSNCL